MKNFLLFLIPTITIAAIIGDLGKPNSTSTNTSIPYVMYMSDTERAAATYHLKD